MKTFYASLLLLALLLAVIFFNTAFIRGTTEDMLHMLDKLPPCDSAEGAIHTLTVYWEEHKTAVGLSACEDAVLDLDTRLTELLCAAEQKEASDFATAARLTRKAILRIQDAERFTTDNLF